MNYSDLIAQLRSASAKPERNTLGVGDYWNLCDDAYDAITALVAERDALRLDAERYRLVKKHLRTESAFDRYEGHRLWFAIYDPEMLGLDAAIDAAMAQEKRDE